MRKLAVLAASLIVLVPSTTHAQTDGRDIPPINSPIDPTGLKVAVRLDPPKPLWPTGLYGLPIAPFGLTNCQEMTFYRQQFGLPAAFDGIGWRESNCRNEDIVHTSCCWGYWQMHQMHFRPGNVMDRNCDADSYTDVNSNDPFEKQKQACSVKQLYDAAGMSPWSATA